MSTSDIHTSSPLYFLGSKKTFTVKNRYEAFYFCLFPCAAQSNLRFFFSYSTVVPSRGDDGDVIFTTKNSQRFGTGQNAKRNPTQLTIRNKNTRAPPPHGSRKTGKSGGRSCRKSGIRWYYWPCRSGEGTGTGEESAERPAKKLYVQYLLWLSARSWWFVMIRGCSGKFVYGLLGEENTLIGPLYIFPFFGG